MTDVDQSFQDAHEHVVCRIIDGLAFGTAMVAPEQAPVETPIPPHNLVVVRGNVVAAWVPSECLRPEPPPLCRFGPRGTLRLRWSRYLAEGWRR